VIILDTNVVSETMKPQPTPAVIAWLDRQVVDTLFLTSLTQAELLAGVAAMPDGQRRDRLASSLDATFSLFDGRILPFDEPAARHYAQLAAATRQSGRGFPVPDGYIAAIAAARGFAVASRDASAFRAAGLQIIDPWAP
jgi:predicted nucleic acid-binding protein